MRVVVDAREYPAPVSSLGFHGGTETILREIVHSMVEDGHLVDVIANMDQERWLYGARWWPAHTGPRTCNTLIACERLDRLGEFAFDAAYCQLNRIDPVLAGYEGDVNAFAVFSDTHSSYLRMQNPTIQHEQVKVIPLGVEPAKAEVKVPYRLIWCNSPDRGLYHFEHIWPKVRAAIPEATMVVTYRVMDWVGRVSGSSYVEAVWARQIRNFLNMDGVIHLDAVPAEELAQQQAQAELFAYPNDPWHYGDAVECMGAREAAAAGCSLLLSHCEALPELFDGIAHFNSFPIVPNEWADAIVTILQDRDGLKKAQARNIRWARERPWKKHHQAWRGLVKNGHGA